jgi:hypothetical protein
MAQFRTPVEVPSWKWQTGYGKKNLFIGSCFTENIGEIMNSLAFDIDLNPFGIIYNPVSVADSVMRLIEGREFTADELFQFNGLWHSYRHHGRFSEPSNLLALEKINERFRASSSYIRETNFLFITLGTAWIYELKESGMVVANCHKVPANQFRRYRLTVTRTVEKLKDSLNCLWDINPDARVVFTVSPIRHTNDGAIANQLSKATLLLAIDALVQGYGHQRCTYFPSYELVMDELRDYRFYAGDMIHLSDTAINYIWNKFEETAIDKESREWAKKVASVNKAASHKPINKFTREHSLFLENTLIKVREISSQQPLIKLHTLQDCLENKITEIKQQLEHNC